ncbi:hypothetical protein ACFU99_01635 [Streptomyces sp. NPDC057654]|uniref:hypothetical protein n=1 Tax=Streptomyces sp. NPDC057654 TaxID=3346196 RepID=UPI0036B8A55C
MTHSWEILRLHARSQQIRPAERTCHHERATRVTVTVHGRLGTATAHHGPTPPDLDTLIQQAIRRAAHGPQQPAARGAAPQPAPPALAPGDLRGLSWLQASGTHTQHITTSVESSTGNHRHTALSYRWHELSSGRHLLARIPPGAPEHTGPPPAHDRAHWLIPPHALSQVLLQPILNALTGRTRLDHWPHTSLSDPAWHRGTDYEGTPRTPTTFADHGTLRTHVTDRATAWTHRTHSSGHSGLSGPVVRDLVLAPEHPPQPLPATATLVVAAALLACGPHGNNPVISLRPLGDDGTPQPPALITPRHLAAFLDHGQWCGPWQRGAGPWTSPWLMIGAPAP